MTGIAVMLADDHRLVREALRDALAREADIHVVGEAGSGEEALALVARVRPDVLVLDIGLPKMNGIEVAARLRSTGSDAKIVALSAYTDKRFVTEMLRAGTNAFVAKSAAGLDLVRAIRAVMSGQTYLCPEIAGAVVSSMNQGAASPRLGRREEEVLRLVAQGERSSGIAGRLNLSVATVEVHRRNIMRKLGLRSVAELTRYAVREGIADL
jgi:two-component system NarL family response regulator